MFRKKWLVTLLVVLLTLLLTQAAVAVEYTLADTGDIQGTEIYLDPDWYSRPGLDTFPDPAKTYGPYPVQAQLAGDTIQSANLHYGPPGGDPIPPVGMTIAGSQISGEIPVIDPAVYGFDYCQPFWPFSFYLTGYDSEWNFVENDERHYADGTGGDPYLFLIENQNPNQPPIADPGGPYEVDRWDPIALDGNGSYDPEGFGLTFEWDIYVTWHDYEGNPYYEYNDNFIDGAGPTPVFTFEENGEYRVRLRVTDECGEQTVEETTIMVYDPHMVVIPQHNSIVGNNWRPGLMLTLEIDGVIYDNVEVVEMGEKDVFGYHFNMDQYQDENDEPFVVVPGMEVILYGDYDTDVIGDEIVRPHTVRDFSIDEVDPDADTVAGTAPAGTYVRVRIDEPWWVEIQAWADSSGYWEADFGSTGMADIQPETIINVLQQNEDDSSHTLRFWGEEEEPGPVPFFTIQPEHKWAHGEFWPIGVPITLTIYEDGPMSDVIYQDTQDSKPADHDPEIGAVEFHFWEVEELQRGLYVSMTDGEIIKDTWIADLFYHYLDIGLDKAEGHGPGGNYGFMVASYPDNPENTEGFFMELPESAPGVWTVEFGNQFDATNVPDTFILRRDEDGDETMIHLPEPLFIEGSPLVDPIEVGTPVPIWATFESFLLENGAPLLGIDFCIAYHQECFGDEGPLPNFQPANTLIDKGSLTTGDFEVVFNDPGVYPAFAHAFNPDGPDSFAFLGLIVVYDPIDLADGFVTGGGWITAAEGSYLPDPSLSGKATYGFVSKYQKKADVPSGQTEFHLNIGDMKFKSTSYDWLIITWNDMAIYSGTGTINGEGEYHFLIRAGDGEFDTFRIRIWEQDANGEDNVIFDNGFDQPTEGGNIVIHRK